MPSGLSGNGQFGIGDSGRPRKRPGERPAPMRPVEMAMEERREQCELTSGLEAQAESLVRKQRRESAGVNGEDAGEVERPWSGRPSVGSAPLLK